MIRNSFIFQPLVHCEFNSASKIYSIKSAQTLENVNLVMKTSQHSQNALSFPSSMSFESNEDFTYQNIQFSQTTLSENQQGIKSYTTQASNSHNEASKQERAKQSKVNQTIPDQVQSHCNFYCSMIHKEWQLLQSILPHPNIIQVYKVFQNVDSFCKPTGKNQDISINQQNKKLNQHQLLNTNQQTPVDSCCALLMEEAEMDLFDLVAKCYYDNKRKMIRTVIDMYRQISQGLEHIHSLNYAHNDIKSENVLIFNQYSDAKITDFGLANDLRAYDNLTKDEIKKKQIQQWEYRCLNHAAPEILKLLKYKKKCFDEQKADVFAFGVSLFESIFGFRPFSQYALSSDSIYKHFSSKQSFSRFWKTNSQIQSVLKEINNGDIDINSLFDVIYNTLQMEPEQRISSADLLIHPLFD